MTDIVRLTLVSHAMTDAMAAGRFPDDEPLNSVGLRQAKEIGMKGKNLHLTAPERRAKQTAEALGLRATTDPMLSELDCGRWRGQPLSAITPAELEVWLTDPGGAPHGGESIVDLIERVSKWLGPLNESTVAVTHPAVIRAVIMLALDAPPKSFWRIDVAPASRTILHFRDGRWTLRHD